MSDEYIDTGELVSAGTDAARVVRPGDILVIRTDAQLRPADADVIRRLVRDMIPDLGDVFILSEGLRFDFVFRPDEVAP